MVGSVPDLERAQVIAYRVAAQEFDRPSADPADLAVLDLGVQDTPNGSAQLALAARTSVPAPESDALVLTWSWRGAPHLHRRSDVAALGLVRQRRSAVQSKPACGALVPCGTRTGPDALGRTSKSKIAVGR
jgi:hypothetical protein